MLNELEKDIIQGLLDNEKLLNVVKKSFNHSINRRRPPITTQDDDAVIGQKYRAFEYAQQLMTDAINELEEYKKQKEQPEKFNKSR